MKRLRYLKALIIKESYQIVRDPSTILISIVLPMLLLFLYGFGVSLDLKHLRVGLVLEETTPDAMRLAESFTNSPYFDARIVRDRRELLEPMTAGAIRGFIVIPSYFSAFKDRGALAPIQVITDGSEPNTANFVNYYAQGAFSTWLIQEALDRGGVSERAEIVIQPRFWYNEEVESRYFLLSGSLAIIMTLVGTLLTALVVAREWERGTMEALMATPIGTVDLVLGKVIPYFVLGLLSMALSLFVSVVGYGLPFQGSLWVLGLVSSAFLFCALGLGLMISTLCKNQILAYQLALFTGFLPAYILSGYLFEISSMPFFVQLLTYVIPARYFVQCLQTLFLVGDVWSLIGFNILLMGGMGLFFFLITAHKTVKRLDG
jgi:ABC-2 type transport system permease protein